MELTVRLRVPKSWTSSGSLELWCLKLPWINGTRTSFPDCAFRVRPQVCKGDGNKEEYSNIPFPGNMQKSCLSLRALGQKWGTADTARDTGKVLVLGWELNKSPLFLVFPCSKPQICTLQHVYRQLRIQKTMFLKKEWVLAEKLGRLQNLGHSNLLFVSKKYLSFNHESNSPLKMLPWITQWSDKSEPYKKKAASPCHQHKSDGFFGRTQYHFLQQLSPAHPKGFQQTWRLYSCTNLDGLWQNRWLSLRFQDCTEGTVLHASTHHKSSMSLLVMLLAVTCAGPSGGDWVQSGSKTQMQKKPKTFPTDDSQPFPFQKDKSSFRKG